MDSKPSSSTDWSSVQNEIFSYAAAHSASPSWPCRRYSGAQSRPLSSNQRLRSLSLSLSRACPKTSVFGQDDDTLHESAIDDSTDHHVGSENRRHAPGGGAIKGILRRASHSIRGIVHRRPSLLNEQVISENSPSESPPSTAHSTWTKLRQAASFRHSRSICALDAAYNAATPYRPAQPHAPIPALGHEPPYIPEYGGAAAKAAAALQNEFTRQSLHNRSIHKSCNDDSNDHESGIGIVLNRNSTDFAVEAEMVSNVTHVSRVDFVTQLPVELAITILGKLDAAALAKISTVSRGWANVIRNQHIWRESYIGEMGQTYATSQPIEPNKGLGIPKTVPNNDWKRVYQIKQELDQRWKEGQARSVSLSGHSDSVYCVQFDESKIVSGSRDRTIRIWDMHTYECRLIIGPPEVVQCDRILADKNGNEMHFAFSSDKDKGSIITSRPKVVSFDVHHKASILCLQYDEEILVTGSSDGTAIVYNVKDGYRPIHRLERHSSSVLDVVFDDKYIVTCSKDSLICVWDRKTGAFLRQLSGHGGPVNAVQLRGKTIVSCSGDFLVKLWNIETGKNICEFAGHTKGLACSQFSEDGRWVASAGNDKVIRVWDARTGECVHEMPAHENLVRSLHIDSVSGRLISGSYDSDIKVWDMRTGRQLLDFPSWHASWVLSAKSDYRRIVSTGQAAKIVIMDFGGGIEGVEMLESCRVGFSGEGGFF